MQENAEDDPGKCFAVYAEPGDVVVVPPGWAHATISADPAETLTFGAWCDREYGFEYDKVRSHGGLAWYPIYSVDGTLDWIPNLAYQSSFLEQKQPREYLELGICKNVPIYAQFEQDPDLFQYVSKPSIKDAEWRRFNP